MWEPTVSSDLHSCLLPASKLLHLALAIHELVLVIVIQCSRTAITSKAMDGCIVKTVDHPITITVLQNTSYIKAVSIKFFPNCQIIRLEELLGCPQGEVNECMLMCFRTNKIQFQLILAKLGYRFACSW